MNFHYLFRLRSMIFLFAGVIITGALGCAPVATQIKDEIPRPILKVSISELKDTPAKWQNKEVSISGKYKGWDPSCSGSGQRTRSDWVIQDDTGCIFVTGIMPDHLSPTQPKGELLSVKGILRLTTNGLPYLEASEVKIMPGSLRQ